jgi:hypothetical protein
MFVRHYLIRPSFYSKLIRVRFFTAIKDPESPWKHTSRWRSGQLETLKIGYLNSSMDSIIGNADIHDIKLPEDVDRLLLPGIQIGIDDNNVVLNNIQRKFYNRVIQLYDFKDEPPVDLVARDLLDCTDYESTKLHFRPKPKMKMVWRSHNITSESDYGVYSDRSRGQTPSEYLLIVEDKRPGEKGALQPERQLAGEMLVAVYNRAELRMGDKEIFGMIMRGDRIRFYKCNFSEEYLRSIVNDKHPKEYAQIYRYPPDNEDSLSISHPQQRELILRILCTIREHLEEIVSKP